MKKYFVTGAAGFIGFHLSKLLLESGHAVVGFDNMNPYYDTSLKESRLAILRGHSRFSFVRDHLENRDAVRETVAKGGFDTVVNLAAQAGVRYSLTHPETYIGSNLVGFFHILDACREFSVPHFMYASSSSVYGMNQRLPFTEQDQVDTPVSLYAATKKSNELIAHSYSSMFGLRTTGFRFFTVFGPYGRPDMALFIFTKNMLEGKPITVFNNGDMMRDFTYVDDITGGILALGESASKTKAGVPYGVYNIGNSRPVQLMDFIRAIEKELGVKAEIELLPMQPGDVKSTYADTSRLRRDTGFSPSVTLSEGIRRFVAWYRGYYGV